jgi:hypothetical protein
LRKEGRGLEKQAELEVVVEGSHILLRVKGEDGFFVGKAHTEAVGIRLVACWNALIGVPTTLLENLPDGLLLEMLKERDYVSEDE